MNAERAQHRYFENTQTHHYQCWQDCRRRLGLFSAFLVHAGCARGNLPGVSVDEAKRTLEQTIRAACRDDAYLSNNPPTVTYNGFTAEGYVLEEGTEAEATLQTIACRRIRCCPQSGRLSGLSGRRVFAL